MTFEEVAKGSPRHKVKTLTADGLLIAPVSRNDSDIEAFQQLVAAATASAEDYEIMPHTDYSNPKGRWDAAAITRSR
jgi:hypothetical protein